ncbi:MAG: putative bifunctional diguanylate cyclase/phosphodiesterase [Pseudobdellovibrionaceae bacterium]
MKSPHSALMGIFRGRRVLTNEDMANAAFGSDGYTPTPQIWKSKVSWRIAIAVFVTIMCVQGGILALTLKDFEQSSLDELVSVAEAAISNAIDKDSKGDFPFDEERVNRIITQTPINGFSLYNKDFDLIDFRGEPPTLSLDADRDLSKTYRSEDGMVYETVFRSGQLNGLPYYMSVRLNAREAADKTYVFIRQSLMIMALMSALVTIVIMVTLGHWLLEPLLFLNANLKAAAASPENPPIPRSPYKEKDDMGAVIVMAQRLIKQNAKNIREIKSRAQDQIHKLAYFDTLTGLPNRTNFIEKLTAFTQRSENSPFSQNTRCAVVALDLDHFKDINDSMGHSVGDAILKAVGQRLISSLPETAIIARSGEDEFAIAMPLVGNIKSARQVAERVQSVVRSAPFTVFNENFQVRCSIGAATFPDDGKDPDQVLKNADIALNRAKEDGRDVLREYLEDFDRLVQARFQLLRDLRDALEHKQLLVYYQPQLDLKSGKIIGAEALMRWWKPDDSKEGGRFISPAEFIPVAEQSGLIVPIGEWVLREACRTAKEWHKQGLNIRIAVNVSGAQFHQGDLVAVTRSVLEETGIEPHLLELEVTESIFMDDVTHAISVLQQLHALGIELAIDDFGTGYSSLSYLRQFPIDRLKIDQSFIRNALNDTDDASIARTIITLGHSLNLKVIAEGVETSDHEKFLKKEGCDEVQGYRYCKPVTAYDLEQFAKKYNGKLSFFDKA